MGHAYATLVHVKLSKRHLSASSTNLHVANLSGISKLHGIYVRGPFQAHFRRRATPAESPKSSRVTQGVQQAFQEVSSELVSCMEEPMTGAACCHAWKGLHACMGADL